METNIAQNHSWWERLLNLISIIKPGEGKSCLMLTLNACLLMSAYYLLKVIREPLILSYGGAEYKSYATAAQAGLLILIVPLFSAIYHHYSQHEQRSAIINRILIFFIANLAIFAVLQYLQVNVGIAFYVWLGIFSLLVVAQFWAYAADLFNVRSGQRLFVILAVGATLGAWIGSRIAGVIFPIVGISGIMLVATGVLILSVLLTAQIDNCVPLSSSNTEKNTVEENTNRWLDGFAVIKQNNYLMLIAVFVTVLVFVNSTGEYILARLVDEYSRDLVASNAISDIGQWQGQFYSSYYSWITLGSFLIQLFIVSRIFTWIGVKGALLVLPIIMIIGYGVMLFFPIFSFIRMAMIAENSTNYSLQNTTRHALFLPVPRRLKYLGKTTIETFFYRFGDLLYGGFIFVATQMYDWQVSAFILSNVIGSIVLLLVAWRVGQSNVRRVQESIGNSPPQVVATIPDLQMPAGKTSKFSVSECTFYDPDIGDALKYKAVQESGGSLPQWVNFDKITRTFTFNPPKNHESTMTIKISATDFEGLTASTLMKVQFVKAEG